jgi:RimJ/RimL family protein N-acetyltransferase
MSESTKGAEPICIKTAQEGLTLVQMLTRDDDMAYFDLQNANIEYWKEFGNSIDESVEKVTKRRLEHGSGRFGIQLDDKLIGIASYSTKGHDREAEVGVLLDKDAAGHGYASAAVKAITDFAKSRFDRIFSEVAPDNAKSINLLIRSGYQTNGELVERKWGKALVFEALK